MRRLLLLAAAVVALVRPLAAAADPAWDAVLAKARGQDVAWNAWAGDDRVNAFIEWVNHEVQARYGITVHQVKLRDTAEAVTRVIAEKQGGRDQGGSVDLIWINGPNFLALKDQNLLYGPVVDRLPNARYIDTHRQSNLIDFHVPTEGFEVPWRVAQLVFAYDSAHLTEVPRTIPALLLWARAHPGRMTHPSVRNFMGATFLKQALYELAPYPAVLDQPVTDAAYERATAPLWAWYDQLRPLLWHEGQSYPESSPAQRQLMADGEVDFLLSFNPAEAAVSIANGLLPASTRVYTLDHGTIGNTSFVAIPYNAAHKEAAMVVANFLIEPATQAHAQDPAVMASISVLDPATLDPADAALFAATARAPGMPAPGSLARSLPEPHPSWMTRLTADWEKRYVH